MNPFNERPMDIEKALQNWEQMYPTPYNKRDVSPYTKTRIILMNGTEFEANWFLISAPDTQTITTCGVSLP